MYCTCLERVSNLCPCPMSLNIAGIYGIHPGITVGAPYQCCLGHRIRRGNASCTAILIYTALDSQCADEIVVVQCILV